MKQGLFKFALCVSSVMGMLHAEDIQDYALTNYGLSKPARPAMKVASLPAVEHAHDGEAHEKTPMVAPVVVNVPSAPKSEVSKLTVDVDGNSELGQLVKQIKEELSQASKQREADLQHAKKLIKELEVYKKRAANERAKNVKLTKKVASLNGKLRAAAKEKEAASHAQEEAGSKEQPKNAEKSATRVPAEGEIDLFEECPPSAKKEAAKTDAHASKSTEKPKAEAHAEAKH